MPKEHNDDVLAVHIQTLKDAISDLKTDVRQGFKETKENFDQLNGRTRRLEIWRSGVATYVAILSAFFFKKEL